MEALVEGLELAGGKEGRVQENEAKHEADPERVPVGNMIEMMPSVEPPTGMKATQTAGPSDLRRLFF
jgi:hypothetical protein